MCQLISAGPGGLHAHGHSSIWWRRHILTVHRFFTAAPARNTGATLAFHAENGEADPLKESMLA